ncbi:MAG: hypothetical protein IT381_10025 [Deltaproteobacteria bacterium]|nr:hypothetical protein [Deltaproteobacteria bacterium]
MPTPIDRTSLKPLITKGEDLGERKDWSVKTSGADVKFNEKYGNYDLPTLVVTTPKFSDPTPQDLATPLAATLQAATKIDDIKKAVDAAIAANKAHFDATDITGKGKNEVFGVQQLRRDAFVQSLQKVLATNALPAAEKAKIGLLLVETKEALIVGRAYAMEVGTEHNYWPYWNNYVSVLEKMLEQVSDKHPAYAAIKARIEDIYNHKHVAGWNRSINEADAEGSMSMAVVFRPIGAKDVGHRVSLAKASTREKPQYEVLTVKKTGLAAADAQYAGAKVYREGTKYFFDYAGPKATPNRTGQAVPASLEAFLDSQKVQAGDLGLRPLVPGEKARSNVPFDWDTTGYINPGSIDIGWWGHCHNESPANALGLVPKHQITWYRAGEKDAKALQTFGTADQWNVVGNLLADREAGYISRPGSASQDLDTTSFVGDRNNGGHDVRIKVAGRSDLNFDFDLSSWTDASGNAVSDVLKAFRTNLESADGKTFAKNPSVVSNNGDLVVQDGLGKSMAGEVKYVDLDGQGFQTEKKEYVTLDAKKDVFTKIGGRIISRGTNGVGGVVEEVFYNAMKKEIQTKRVTVDVDATTGNAKRTDGPMSASAAVTGFEVRQETSFDSVKEIHDFVTAKTGLPFVFDTSPEMQVWNYPVKFVKLDQVSRAEQPDGSVFTRYKLEYQTEGGPGDTVEYILKRDASGKVTDSVALNPMPDFAFRHDGIKMGAVALDPSGRPVFNLSAYEKGYLTDDQGGIQPGLALYERQLSLLYASLSAKADSYVYETEEGKLIRFTNKADFDALVKAREALEAPTPPTPVTPVV